MHRGTMRFMLKRTEKNNFKSLSSSSRCHCSRCCCRCLFICSTLFVLRTQKVMISESRRMSKTRQRSQRTDAFCLRVQVLAPARGKRRGHWVKAINLALSRLRCTRRLIVTRRTRTARYSRTSLCAPVRLPLADLAGRPRTFHDDRLAPPSATHLSGSDQAIARLPAVAADKYGPPRQRHGCTRTWYLRCNSRIRTLEMAQKRAAPVDPSERVECERSLRACLNCHTK
jgi:hypothetical protein